MTTLAHAADAGEINVLRMTELGQTLQVLPGRRTELKPAIIVDFCKGPVVVAQPLLSVVELSQEIAIRRQVSDKLVSQFPSHEARIEPHRNDDMGVIAG